MRRWLKLLHTLGAAGLIGAMLCLLVLLAQLPPPASLPEYARMRAAMGGIGLWIFLPSMGLTLLAGLLSVGFTRAFHEAGWAWTKLVMGILVFEWGIVAVLGPLRREADLSALALAGEAEVAELALSAGAERASLWVMLAVAAVNVVLGIWRPRMTRRPASR
jgi:hypothetical protein